MRHELNARRWSARQIFGCLIVTVFLTAIALLQWPQKRSHASPRPASFEAWAAWEDAQNVRPLRPINSEEYSDILVAVGEVPSVPSTPDGCEVIDQEAIEANFLALDAGKTETKTSESKRLRAANPPAEN